MPSDGSRIPPPFGPNVFTSGVVSTSDCFAPKLFQIWTQILQMVSIAAKLKDFQKLYSATSYIFLPDINQTNFLTSAAHSNDWLSRLRKSKIINPCSSSPKQKAQKQWKEWRDGKENKKFRYARLPFIKTENKTVLQSCGTERTLQLLHEYMDAYSLTNFRGKTPLNNDLTKLSAITNLGAILVS